MSQMLQCVTLSWEWGGKKEEMELWDIQFDGKGRLDWAAVKETFSADVVRILGKGTPPLLKKGEWEGYTRETFQPGSTIQLSVDRRGQGSIAPASIELPSGHSMARFWTSLRNADIVKGSDGFKFLKLEGHAFFMGSEFNQSSILLRKCYQDLWDLVTAGVKGRCIITGTPGIGVTSWHFFALHKLAMMGATVVIDFKGYDDCYCFSGSFVRKGPLRAFEEELYQEATWYLVDAKEPSLYDAKTILTTRPRREIWKDFAKAGASSLLMPVWSEDELKAAGQCLYNLTEQEVHTLFAKWGGSARYVLQYARDPRRQMDLDIAIANATTDMIFKGMGESGNEVSQRILHIRVWDDYIRSDAIFASEYIARKVGESLCASNTIPLENFIVVLAGEKPYSDVRGKLFESVAHRLLACGDKFTSLNLETGEEQDWELPASNSTQTFHNLSDVSRQDDGLYWMPQNSNETAIDSLRQPSMLFKMTVAETHSINAIGICRAAEQLLSSDPELIYVVPPDIYSRWRSKQLYTGRQDPKGLKKINQRVVRLPLHILHPCMQSVLGRA